MKPFAFAFLAWCAVVLPAFSQNNDCNTFETCQAPVKENPKSSLVHYRLAEMFLQKMNYQSAGNEFREALNSDLDPKWTEVWSHINLGKIFDITNQRERAVNEYRMALRIKDNTRGAQDEAAQYIESPCKRSAN